jgi:diguanylate cyclase (GGDEF)-like protein
MNQDNQARLPTIVDIEKHLGEVGSQANELRANDPRRAAKICVEAIAEARQASSESRAFLNLLAHVQVVLSLIYIQLAEYHSALLQALEAYTIYEKIDHDHGISRSLSAVGTANMHLGNYPEAFAQLMRGVKICEQIGDIRYKAVLLHRIGNLHIRLEDYEKALAYLEESLTLSGKNGEDGWRGELLADLCAAHFHLGDLDNALRFGRESAKVYDEAGDQYGVPIALNAVGQVYLEMGEYEQARTHHLQALELCESISNFMETIQTLYHLGKLFQAQGQADTALDYLNQALEKASEMGAKHQVYRCHRELANMYQEIGDYKNALDQYKSFHNTKEAVITQQIEHRLQSLEVMHRLSEIQRDAEIYRLKSSNLENEIEERKKTQAKLEELAATDPLTGLLNRRHFFERFEEELDRAVRFDVPISVVMVDIDHFKRINDQHGHLVGDQVLIEIAKRINNSLRKIDTVCRYGGEEFAILLPGTDLSQAEQVAERVWRKVADTPIKRAGFEINVSVSLGVANKKQAESMTSNALIDHADQALYAAKKAGRNQVKIYQ